MKYDVVERRLQLCGRHNLHRDSTWEGGRADTKIASVKDMSALIVCVIFLSDVMGIIAGHCEGLVWVLCVGILSCSRIFNCLASLDTSSA